MSEPSGDLPQVESVQDADHAAADPSAYWRANLILIGSLLAIWAIVSYGCGILFVEQLNQIKLGHLPLGFWFAQQGSIYVFVILIFVYAFAMDRLDRKHGQGEQRKS